MLTSEDLFCIIKNNHGVVWVYDEIIKKIYKSDYGFCADFLFFRHSFQALG